MRQSAGHIRIYSELGEGTTVKIYLPRYVGTRTSADRTAAVTLSGTRAIGAECILVVEDDAALRAYTLEILSELGYGVLEAPNGAAALEMLQHRRRRSTCCSPISLCPAA